MNFNLKRYFLGLLFLVFCIFSTSIFANWKMIPSESKITFTGTQNGSPATGSFNKFTGEINFDPNQLKSSKVRIIIDMNSISMSYKEFASTLVTSDWLNVKRFPQAIFQSTQFTKIGDKKFEAQGNLTIRDKSNPLKFTFDVVELAKDKVRVNGTFTIKRTAFGIGQGEWADTDTIKDDVVVNVEIIASNI